MECFKIAAQKGHIAANNIIGSLYEGGLGVKQSYSEALKWYKKIEEISRKKTLCFFYTY